MTESTDAILDRISSEARSRFFDGRGSRDPLTARSANDHTEVWPFWFVADRAGLNVTTYLTPELRGYLPFVGRDQAEALAAGFNEVP